LANKKYSKKQLKHMMKEDEFASSIDKAVHWIQHNRGMVIAGVVALFAVISVYVIATSYSAATRNRSENALAQAMEILYYQPKQGETPKYADKKAQLEAALKELDHVLSLNPTDAVAQRARYYRADVFMKLKQDAKATEELAALFADTKPPFKTLVALKYAGLLKAHGDRETALQVLDDVSNLALADGLLTDYVLMEKGRLQKEMGKLEDARATFTKLTEEYPDSRYVAEAKNELDKLNG